MSVSDPERDPIDAHVGAQLRSLRMQNRMTQAGLADALGVTFQQVQKYEKGTNRMAASTLARAATALGCVVTDFYPPAEGVDPEQQPREAIAELTALYGAMGRRQREALLVTARALADLRGRSLASSE